MTTACPTRAARRRAARIALAGAALLAAVPGASADDGGLGGFLSSIFGQPAAAPAPAYAPSAPAEPRVRRPRAFAARPLTVRLRPAKPRLVVAQAPAKPGKVSIYEDRTLRPGDAVMTAQGLRIFAGSSSWPYTKADFVALSDARNLDRTASNTLAQLDKVPRG